MGHEGGEYIEIMFRQLLARASAAGARIPSQCAVCHAWPRQAVCADCVARFAQRRARCATCAVALEGGARQCGACLRDPPPLDACFAAVDYAYPWADIIARFKFQGESGWAATLAQRIAAVPGVEAALERATHVLPMPLEAARLRQRGYNQALLLARQLAGRHADAHLLLRVRPTLPQPGLTRAQRLRNVRSAFALEPLRASQVRGAHAVLIDDVMTTGASLYAAAAALRRAGAATVTAAVMARTPEGR